MWGSRIQHAGCRLGLEGTDTELSSEGRTETKTSVCICVLCSGNEAVTWTCLGTQGKAGWVLAPVDQ